MIKSLLFLTVLFQPAIFSQGALEELKLGKERLEAKDCKKAIIHFQNALDKNKNSLESKLGFAQCSSILGSFADSKRAYSEVLARDPKNFSAVIGISEIYLELNQLVEIPKKLDPLLEEFPNNTGLRILESKYLFAISKKELAIHKLEKLNERLNHPIDVERMLGELYLLSGKWKESEESLSRYISNAPSDPNGFYLKAKLILFRNYFRVSDLVASLAEAEENIQNALNLDANHEKTRFLFVKLKMIQANKDGKTNLEILEKAFRIIYELAREFPDNEIYHSIEASLGEELDRKVFSTYHFRRALQLDDLDEIVRFEAEEYCIKNDKEESKFRRELGEYRRERYIAEKQSLYFKSAKFHLLRAKNLKPRSPNVMADLLEFYDLSGESSQFINLLLRFRDEDPDDFKLQNKLEYAIQSLKKSLEAREGYIQIDQKGVLHMVSSVSPEVYVFDLESRLAFPEHFPGGRLIGKALRYELKNAFNIRLPSDTEYSNIRLAIKETNFHPFTKTVPFSVEALYNLDKERRNTTKIRYILHGNYQFSKDTIDIEVSLYDRNSSKDIGKWYTNQKGRDSLSTIIARIAENVKNVLPVEGKILKIKKDEVLISLGKKDGLTSKSTVVFLKKGIPLMEGEITELGNDISLVKPKLRGWERDLATGDFVTLRISADKDQKNK